MTKEPFFDRLISGLEDISNYILDYFGKYGGRREIGLEEKRQREMDYLVLCRQAALTYYNRNYFRGKN